jgi:hypothetical protein
MDSIIINLSGQSFEYKLRTGDLAYLEKVKGKSFIGLLTDVDFLGSIEGAKLLLEAGFRHLGEKINIDSFDELSPAEFIKIQNQLSQYVISLFPKSEEEIETVEEEPAKKEVI